MSTFRIYIALTISGLPDDLQDRSACIGRLFDTIKSDFEEPFTAIIDKGREFELEIVPRFHSPPNPPIPATAKPRRKPGAKPRTRRSASRRSGRRR